MICSLQCEVCPMCRAEIVDRTELAAGSDTRPTVASEGLNTVVGEVVNHTVTASSANSHMVGADV